MENILLILKLFPLLIEAIQAIEASAPVPAVGAAKLDLLTGAVREGYKSAHFSTNMISQDQLIAWLQAITASIVTFYNIVGIFKKSPTPQP
jgi:hypothetical protein